jgi:hypothetical protein
VPQVVERSLDGRALGVGDLGSPRYLDRDLIS